MKYILYQYDRVPIRTTSKNLACGAFCLISAFCFIKNLACSAIFFLNWYAFDLKFLILSTNSFVVKMIRKSILSDHNNTVCTKQLL